MVYLDINISLNLHLIKILLTPFDRSQSCRHFIKKPFKIRPDTPKLEQFSRQRFFAKNYTFARKRHICPFLRRVCAPHLGDSHYAGGFDTGSPCTHWRALKPWGVYAPREERVRASVYRMIQYPNPPP